MHKIKEKLMEELYKVEEKMKKASGGSLSAGDLEYVHKLTDTIKNIDKIEMLEDGDYSEAGEYMGEGRIYGTSYARGRGRNARRDSMGRYSRDGGMYSETDGMMHHDGRMSERRGYSRRGGYSYGDAKEEMCEKLVELLEMAETDNDRRVIEHCKRQIERA